MPGVDGSLFKTTQSQNPSNSPVQVEGGGTESSYISSLSSKGSPLPIQPKSFFEQKFRRNFSNVRIHNDIDAAKSAERLNAHAYTIGNNIVFNQGQFSPETENGKKLLAHELVHINQKQNSVIHRKDKGIDKETFMRENCIGVDIDPSKEKCFFKGKQEAVIRIAKDYAITKCSNAVFALQIIQQEQLNFLSKLIFHVDKAPPRDFIRTRINDVRTKLENIPIVCKTCFDENCNKGGIMAYTPLDHTSIDICPLFFNDQKLTETPRYIIHEGCHLADIDKTNFLSRAHNEGYCKSENGKFDYWNNPCPEDNDNLTNADAWSFFIDRLSLER
jgi:hypothetical protein